MSDTITNPSVLGIKIDSQTTRLFLFDIVGGKYALLATSEAASTYKAPFFDIREGLFKAIDHLQLITGRYLVDNEFNLIVPGQDDGNGIDAVSISYGFLDEVSIIPAGLLEEVSIESNQNLLQMTHLAILDSIKLNDSRSLDEIFTSIHNNHPDLFLLSGGTFNGAIKPVLRLVEIILFCTQHLKPSEMPEIIFAGNSKLIKKLEEISKDYPIKIHVTDNLRPSMEVENLTPALNSINDISYKLLIKKIPGLEYIFSHSLSQPIPYSQGIGTMVNFLSNLNPQKSENVLLIDFNKEMIIVAGNKKTQTKITKKKNLLMGGPEEFLENTQISEIVKWINTEVEVEYLRDYISNKSIHPNSIPENKEELLIEKNILKYLLNDAYTEYKKYSGFNHNTIQQILVNGDYVSPYFSNEELILFLLDTIQPIGITNLFLDQHGILPVLGSIANNNTILPIHLLDSNAISLLAKVFSIPSKTQVDTPLLNLWIEFEDGTKLEETIVNGSINNLPATAGQKVKLYAEVIGNSQLKSVFKPFENGIMVQGGNVGIVFDTRSRPLVIPKSNSERIALLNKWQEILIM